MRFTDVENLYYKKMFIPEMANTTDVVKIDEDQTPNKCAATGLWSF